MTTMPDFIKRFMWVVPFRLGDYSRQPTFARLPLLTIGNVLSFQQTFEGLHEQPQPWQGYSEAGQPEGLLPHPGRATAVMIVTAPRSCSALIVAAVAEPKGEEATVLKLDTV